MLQKYVALFLGTTNYPSQLTDLSDFEKHLISTAT